MSLTDLLEEVRGCRLCDSQLEPRPVLRLSEGSRVLVVGQAPGSKVHASGVPWDDASGDHLREWLGVDRETFDDPRRFGILPLAFCYPGKASGGDLPPPRRCAATWHEPLIRHVERPALTLLIGRYAQKHYLGSSCLPSMTATVESFEDYLPSFFPLPHPAWRSKLWMKKHPWFVTDVLPRLRECVAAAQHTSESAI